MISDMELSGEYIRQTALQREQTCPTAMKDSFFYGFREGAKWALREIAKRNQPQN